MTGRYDDTILRLATLVLRIVMIALWIGIVALALAIPGVLLWQAEVVPELARAGIRPDAMPGILAVMAGAAAMLFLATRFFAKLLALMRTVDDDPFVPENAARLRAMAWLLLAIELLGFALGMIGHWLIGKSNGFELSITGLIAVLSLFVLARVFARGTAMRDDIEGTV